MKKSEVELLCQKYHSQLKKIKAVFLDADGILTDGQIVWMGEEVGFTRRFHVSDGHGIKMTIKGGIEVAVISGGESLSLIRRIETLGIKHYRLGNEDKREGYLQLLDSLGLVDEEVLYMGDEVIDIPILKRVGLAVTVPHASWEVQEVADYTTVREGGQGAVREVLDILRATHGISSGHLDFVY